MDLVIFEIAGGRYALDASTVRQVVRAVTIVPLPKAPPVVEGVINVRGDLVPVMDVRARFGLEPSRPAPTNHLILADSGSRVVAVRADRAVGLFAVPAPDIENARALMPGSGHIHAIAKLPDGLVLIQDLRQFLAVDESAALDRALAGGREALA